MYPCSVPSILNFGNDGIFIALSDGAPFSDEARRLRRILRPGFGDKSENVNHASEMSHLWIVPQPGTSVIDRT